MFNPYSMLLEMAKNNPQMKPVIESLQKGESPEAVFRNLCKEKGVDPDDFIRKFKK